MQLVSRVHYHIHSYSKVWKGAIGILFSVIESKFWYYCCFNLIPWNRLTTLCLQKCLVFFFWWKKISVISKCKKKKISTTVSRNGFGIAWLHKVVTFSSKECLIASQTLSPWQGSQNCAICSFLGQGWYHKVVWYVEASYWNTREGHSLLSISRFECGIELINDIQSIVAGLKVFQTKKLNNPGREVLL